MRTFTKALIASGTLLVVTAPLASAHVTIKPDTTAAGSYAGLTVTVPHGCDGSGTTKIAIQIPESIPQVTPSIAFNWDVTKTMTALPKPVDVGHGKTITERVSEVVYTAKAPLPDGYLDQFKLSVKLPDNAGDTLTFPVIQTCEVGETGWIQVPSEGQSEDDLADPAPQIKLTAAVATAADGDPIDASDSTSASDSGTRNLAIGALILGIIGAALGGFAAFRTSKKG